MSRTRSSAASNSLNGGPFNVSIRNLQRESVLTGKTPPYSAPAAFGRFEVLHQVGAGVLGPVFLARDPERSRSVAVKVFRLDITPEQAAELVSQLGLLARANLAHPSIIAPFEAGIEGTVAYLAEDYVAADSLDSAVRQYGPAPVSQAVRILAAVAGALDFAAAVGVHHGALHPRDLLVTPDDTRVTGLGVGRALEAVGLRAPMRRPYVAPERVQREGWDGRADIYSLGVLARELLAGRAKPDPSGEPHLPDDQAERLHTVLARATAARPSDRFSTCLEFIRAVQDVIAAMPARPMPVPVQVGKARHQPTHDLLLPLEGDESGELGEAPAGNAGRLRLEDPDTVPDLPSPGDGARGAAPLPDLDLRPAPRTDEEPVDAFDLSDLDSQLIAESRASERDDQAEQGDPPQPAPFEREAAVSIAGPRTAELGEPIDLPLPEGDADQPERFTDAYAETSRPTSPPISEEPAAAMRPLPERPALAAERPRRDVRMRPRSRALPLVAMLITGILIGVVVGYFVGAGQTGRAVAPTAPASTQPADVPGVAGARPAGSAAVEPSQQPPTQGPAGRPATPLRNAASPASPKTPAPPAPAAVVRGTLIISSTPRGAAVALDGRPLGVTPVTIRNLAPGHYTVRVSRRGYATEEREVVVSAERPSSTIAFSLDRASRPQPASRTEFFGSLSVDSLPSGARVFLDGRLIGTTPMVAPRVPAGSHVVRVDRLGFLPWTSPIQVVTGQRFRVTASLERESR